MNYLKNLIILAVALISVGLISCSPVAYSTTGQNVPLFQEKGEAMINAGYATATDSWDYADGLNVQAALAVDSSVALISSFYLMKPESEASEGWSGSGNYFDIGVGLFKSTRNKKFVGEVFIGTGFGNIKNSSSDGSYYNIKFMKPFIQPSVGFTIKHFEVAFTPRVALVNFKSEFSGDMAPDLKTTVVFEPGVTLRAGGKYVKFQYQLNASTFTLSDSDYSTFTSYNVYASLGVSFLISKRWADK